MPNKGITMKYVFQFLIAVCLMLSTVSSVPAQTASTNDAITPTQTAPANCPAPGAIAFLTVRSLKQMLPVAVIACMASMLGGVYLSFHIDSAPAPTIVLILTALFILAFVRRSLQVRRASATV